MSDSPFGHKSRHGDCFATWYTGRKAAELVGRHGFGEDDVDDLAQELTLHLIRQWPAFDSTKIQAITFIHKLVDVLVQELIRELCAPKRDHRRERSLSKAAEYGLLDGVRGQPDVSDFDRIDLQDDCRSVLSSLPSELRRIAELLREMTPSAAACELGVPEATLRLRMAELREYFVAAGYGDA